MADFDYSDEDLDEIPTGTSSHASAASTRNANIAASLPSFSSAPAVDTFGMQLRNGTSSILGTRAHHGGMHGAGNTGAGAESTTLARARQLAPKNAQGALIGQEVLITNPKVGSISEQPLQGPVDPIIAPRVGGGASNHPLGHVEKFETGEHSFQDAMLSYGRRRGSTVSRTRGSVMVGFLELTDVCQVCHVC